MLVQFLSIKFENLRLPKLPLIQYDLANQRFVSSIPHAVYH